MSETDERTRQERCCRTPLVDIFETDEGVKFQFELPGVSREDISISLDGDTLRVSSNAKFGEAEQAEVLEREFEPANFWREFVLSRDLDRQKIDASWSSGVLTLSVPKVAEAKPRKIEITAG